VIQLIAKRLAAAVVIVLALTAVMFILQKISPVDPVHAMLGPSASPAAIVAEQKRLGLDRPFLAQFGSYLNGLVHGNFGMSYRTRRPVSTDLGSFLPATAELSLYALIFAVILAGILALSSTRVLRSSLIGQMRSDYVRTARAKGLTERDVVFGHVLRNSVNAGLTMTGLQVGLMFAGVVVIEEIFGWPGMGQYMAQSIPAADFPAISGVTLLLGVGYVAVNTIVDILQAVADPRINA